MMFAPVSQTNAKAIAGMIHEGSGLNYEVHVDVASMMRKDEVVYASYSGSVNVLNDVHYTEITHVTLLHAGENVVVYDRNAHHTFPGNATEITTMSWLDACDTAITDCTSIAEMVRAGWTGSWFRCPQCGNCLLYTSPSPRDRQKSRMPSSA